MARRLIALALVLFGLVPGASAVLAEDATHEAVWTRYWTAIYAQKQCNNVDFTQAQYDAMVHVINQKIDFDLGAGTRLQLMHEAQAQVQDQTFKYGCSSPQVGEMLNLYKSDLAPVAQ